MHQAEENAAHQKAEAGEGDHGHRLEIVFAGGSFYLPAVFQNAAGQKGFQVAAIVSGLYDLIEGSEPVRDGEVQPGSQNRLECLGDVGQIDVGIFQTRRSAMGKELDQQKVDFVAIGVGVFLLAQMMNQQSAQTIVAAQGRGLEKLAQLMDLNVGVHVGKQLPGLLD